MMDVIHCYAPYYFKEDNNKTGSSIEYMDKIIFGNPMSEHKHSFAADDSTSIITGALGESARVSNPLNPTDVYGGDLTFTMKIDPIDHNYFTLKFWGDDIAVDKNIVYINGKQIGYLRGGDYEAIHIGSGAKPLANRFYYNTIMLPLESTYGQETTQITVKTFSGNKVSVPSRGIYHAYTHTQAYLHVTEEKQGIKFHEDVNSILTADLTDTQKQALIDGFTQGQIDLFNNYSAKVDNGDKLSIVRYQDELRFYANTLNYHWSPAKTAAEKRVALERIFTTIDAHVMDYYGNTRLCAWGGHQSDWGGYYGALGEALYIVENLINDVIILGGNQFNAYLDQPFVTYTIDGTNSIAGVDWDGGTLTRRAAWGRCLKANIDFARSRLSYIYNQVFYTYEGAWKAHEGLRIVGSAFYEGKERSHQMLLEALGIIPFLGEEVLVGPNGEELDLYHSLFYHDRTAHFTEDYLQIVVKGFAKSKLDSEGVLVRRLPLGEHFITITEAGLTRENGFVANYGEATNYLPEYFYRTINHEGDEELNNDILKLALKNLHARSYTRYADLDGNGKRIMRMEQVTDERNATYPGNYGYAVRVAEGKALLYASLEMTMVQNEQRYCGPEWDMYWQYAKEAVGFAQQQLMDHQFFNHFGRINPHSKVNKVDYLLADTYQYITADQTAYERYDSVFPKVVHPQTDFDYYTQEEISAMVVDPSSYGQFAWVDIDNMFISLRDSDFRLFGALNERNRGFTGNGRLHVKYDRYDHIVQIATNAKFQYEDYYIRMNNLDVDFMEDQETNIVNVPQALAGEVAPVTYQPGVGKVSRENFEVDHAYSGYPDLLTARYGKYFIVFNTTRDVYGNKQSFEVELPADHSGSAVFDLVSGKEIPIADGKLTILPKSAMVLKLTVDAETARKPFSVNFVSALAGNGYAGITWKTTAGAASYTMKRSETENGTYGVIATGLQGNYYHDTAARNGNVYFYKVCAVNKNGAGWDSYRAKLDLTAPVTLNHPDTIWRDDRIGDITDGSAAITGTTIAIQSANGRGFGEGDDYFLEKRNIHDSLHFVNQIIAGNCSISAKMDSQSGKASGIMMRDLLASNTRYIYFGADQEGNLVLQNRTRDTRHQWSNLTVSPLNAGLQGYKAAEYPYIKLVRDADLHDVHAYVSKDGVTWEMVKKMFTVFPYAAYAGVVATNHAQFSEVSICSANGASR